MAIGNASMEGRRPWVNRFHALPDQVKWKITEKSGTSPSITAEMTGASCLARAVVPRTAAAVDHADTELIGHRGWKGTGFLCDEKQLRLKLLFVFMKAIILRHVSNCHFERCFMWLWMIMPFVLLRLWVEKSPATMLLVPLGRGISPLCGDPA